MRRLIAGLTLAACAAMAQTAPSASAKAPTEVELAARVDKVFAQFTSTDTPGCAVSVARAGKLVYKHGYGMADLDHDVPIRPDTVFHVASISKEFTAAAVVLLAQDGKLSLDDDVRKYVTELPDFGAKITLRHLLYHTSGLRDQWSLLGLAGWRYSQDLITDQDVLDVMSTQKDLNFQPGEKHLYCNTGYTLLAQVVKRVSGKSLREFTTERIFAPLGMHNTHFRDDHAEVVKRMAYGYVRRHDDRTFELSVTNFDTVGATSLLTTVEDMALWADNFDTLRVGGASMLAQMLEKGRLNSGKQIDYGFGLALGSYKGLQTVGHGGADAGYRADFIRFPAQRLAVNVACNLAQANPGEYSRKVAEVYLADELKADAPKAAAPEDKFVELSEQQMKSHAGLYWQAEDAHAVLVEWKDGKLKIGEVDNADTELRALSESRFRTTGHPLTVEFDGAAGMRVKFEGGRPDDVFVGMPRFAPNATQLAEFVGSYRSDEIEPVYRIAVEKDALVLKRMKHDAEKLVPTIADRFRGGPGSIRFTRDAQGKVTGFVLDEGRVRNMRFRKAD